MKELSFNRPSEPEIEREAPAPRTRSQGSKRAPTMRTYGKDVAGLLRDEHITKTQVVMAEEERRETRGEVRTVHNDDSHLTKIILILLAILALGLGAGAYMLIGTTSTTSSEEAPIAEVKKTERMLEVDISNSPREQVISDTAVAYTKTTFTPNESRIIAFTTADTGQRNRDATATELLGALATTKIPETFLRSVHPEISLTIEGKMITDPLIGYLTLTTRSYANSVSGMLEWENTMAPDLIPILDPKFSRTRLTELRDRSWADRRVLGIDVRFLDDANGRVVLMYTFIDRVKIIIAGSEQAMESVLARESKQGE